MSLEKTEIPFKNTLKDILKSHKILNKHSKASVTAKILLTVVRICLLVMTVYGSLFYFKEYYFLRKIIYKPLSETIGYFITGIFLSAVFVAGISYFTILKNFKLKRFYKKDACKNRTMLLTLSDGGVTLSSACTSRFFEWDKVTRLTEVSDGIIISFTGSIVFVPARYISIETITDFRNMILKYLPAEKINFVSRVDIKDEPEQCEPFNVIDLMGKPIKQITVDKFSFDDYFYMQISAMLYFNPDIRTILGTAILFILLLTVFTAKNIFTGILSFIAFSVILLTLIFGVIYLYIRQKYRNAENQSHRITFYSNAIYVETVDFYSVLEYKNILRYREKTYSIVILGHDVVFRISREKVDELEKIKEFIKRKTINNNLT